MITCTSTNDALENVLRCDNRNNPDTSTTCEYSRTFGTEYSISATESFGISQTITSTIEVHDIRIHHSLCKQKSSLSCTDNFRRVLRISWHPLYQCQAQLIMTGAIQCLAHIVFLRRPLYLLRLFLENWYVLWSLIIISKSIVYLITLQVTIDQVVGYCHQPDGGKNAINTNDFRTTSTSRDGTVEVTYWRLDAETGEARTIHRLPKATAEQKATPVEPSSAKQARGC